MQKTGGSRDSRRKGILRQIYKMRVYYYLLIPFFAFIILFKYVPMYGIVLAFKDFKVRSGIMGSPWAGLKYFKELFGAYSFFEVLRNTLVISLEKLVFSFPIPIILAIFVNDIRNQRIKKTFQTLSYLPHFISWIIAASFVGDIFALNGPINMIITAMGGNSIYFMANPRYFHLVIILSNIWKTCGWSSIIYIAAITGIDPELYEAAGIDGAHKLQTIWHITLPCIRPTIITLLILEIGKIMSAGFDQIYNLYSPAVYSVADILDTYTYRQGIIQSNYSYATAAGLFQNLIGFVLVILSNIIIKRLSDEEGLW